MILFKNFIYMGKKSELLVTENAKENEELGFVFDPEDGFHKHWKNYGENYGKQGGRVVALAEKIDVKDGVTVVDMEGKVLFPSLIDVHTHFRDPGLEWKEDINTGLEAGLHGGYSHLLCMANTSPVNDNAGITRYMLEKAKNTHPYGPFLHPVSAATIGLKGEELAPLGEMAEAGCIAVSNDGIPLTSTEIVCRVMEYGKDLDMLFIDHCEDPYLARGAHMNEGNMSAKLGVKGQPDLGEALQVARDAMISEYLNIPVHIAHVSCRKSLEVIKEAKAKGINLTAETCPHYLLLDETAMDNYNTNAKVNPPLRTWDDVLAMRKAVKSGLIDCMITDHAPHASHEKENPLDMVPNGISGLDTAISLLWKLVEEGVFDQSDIVRTYTVNPGKRFKLPYNTFEKGDPADFFFFDPSTEWVVCKENFYSKSANTPFLGQTLKGRVCSAYLGGRKLF